MGIQIGIVNITTIDNKSHSRIACNLSASAIKKLIYKDLCQQLQPGKMSLEINGIKVDDRKDSLPTDSKLYIMPFIPGPPVLNIVQKKASLDSIKGLKVDMEYQCPVSCQKGAATMVCGHMAGTEYMLKLLRTVINSNQCEVRCPEKVNDMTCNRIWDIQTCKKVAILTQSEQQEISQLFSKNWIKKNCKQCPKCQNNIMKVGIDHNRVKCTYCNYGDFCFYCLSLWKTTNNTFCGDQTCQLYINTLRNAPLTTEFTLKKDNQFITVETPLFRACPSCHIILEHMQKCKHTPCSKCEKKFCWVCLKPQELNKSWKCGEPYDHCGVVAPRQYS